MNPGVFVSTAAFGGGSLQSLLDQCPSAGISRVELSTGVRLEPGWRELVHVARETGMQFLVHNYFPPPPDPFVLNLAATDPAILERSVEMVRAGLALAAELAAPFYSVHAGFALNLTPELLGHPERQAEAADRIAIPREAARESFLDAVRTLVKTARDSGVRLLVENNVLSPRYLAKQRGNPLLCCDAAETLWLVEAIADPALGILFDTGHAKVSAAALGFEARDFLEAVAPHIGAWHVSDNDGITDQNAPCREDSWFLPALREHRGAPVVLEVAGLSPAAIAEQAALLERAIG